MLMMPCVNGLQLLGFSEFVFEGFEVEILGWWQQKHIFLEIFTPKIGEDFHF